MYDRSQDGCKESSDESAVLRQNGLLLLATFLLVKARRRCLWEESFFCFGLRRTCPFNRFSAHSLSESSRPLSAYCMMAFLCFELRLARKRRASALRFIRFDMLMQNDRCCKRRIYLYPRDVDGLSRPFEDIGAQSQIFGCRGS